MLPREIDVTKMDPTTFSLGLMGAAPGTVFVYHRGDLTRARKRCPIARAEASWPKPKFRMEGGVKVYESYEDYCNG